MTLASLILAAILSLSHEPTADRAEAIALDIAAVLEAEPDALPWPLHTQTLALVAIGYTESGWRPEVEDCRRSGDHGASVGLWQVHAGPNWEGHSRDEICADRRLQARLALHALSRCSARTRRLESAMHCYASGDAGRPSRAGHAKARLVRTLARRFPAELLELHDDDASEPAVVGWR